MSDNSISQKPNTDDDAGTEELLSSQKSKKDLKNLLKRLRTPKKSKSIKKTQTEELSTEQDSLTLKEAYNLLHIEYYPPTNEEIRLAFYKEECRLEENNCEEKKELLLKAREIITSNISVNPFAENTNPYETEKGGSKFHAKRRFVSALRSKIRFSKKGLKRKKIEKLMNNTVSEGDFSSQDAAPRASKKGVIRFVLFMTIVIVLVYMKSKNDEQSLINTPATPPAIQEDANTEEIQDTEDSYLENGLETMLYLTQKDGIKLGKDTLYPTPGRIADFAYSQRLHIPGLNIYVFTREFMLHNESASVFVKNTAIYEHKNTTDASKSYKKLYDWSSYSIEEFTFDGDWTGECVINNRHILKANNIHLSVTDNGYITGEYSFLPERENAAFLTIEGYYNKDSNKFCVYGKDWIKRPSLFVTPKLVGKYNPATDKLESYAKYEKTARFSFKREVNDLKSPNRQILKHLLKESSATYSAQSAEYTIPLTQLKKITTYTIKEKEDNKVSISYEALLDRDIVDFTIKGNATLVKKSDMWILEENVATATFKELDLTGIYEGEESVGDNTYQCTYKIYPASEENTYIAHVTLKPQKEIFKKSEELRKITFIEKGICMERIDITNYNLTGTETVETYIDYANDIFSNKGVASLKKTGTLY